MTPVARYHDNQNQRSACLLVLDVSTGRRGTADREMSERFEALDRGLALLKNELRADPLTRHKVELSIIEAGGPRDDACVLMDWTEAAHFDPPQLERGRTSHLAQAMCLALNHMEKYKQTLRHFGITYTRPWIMVVSSGTADEPDSVWEGVAKDCRQAERDKRCVLFPISLDGGAGGVLRSLSAAPVANLSTERLPEYFRWLSAGLASTSRSAPGVSVTMPSLSGWATFGTT